MNSKDKDDLKFFCDYLNIKTAKDLEQFKAQHNAKTSKEILNALIKVYNS